MAGRVAAYQIIGFLCCLLGCNLKTTGPSAEPYLSDPASVAFELEPIHGGTGSQQWIGVYSKRGKTAKFGIEFGRPEILPKSETEFSIKTGSGRFISEPGSDADTLLEDLQNALAGKRKLQRTPRLTSLPFTYANLGGNMSQAPGGGFRTNPPGHWTAIKIFVGEGDQEGELFLNFNPVIRKGQFSMKDPDYGDLVLDRLAKVL